MNDVILEVRGITKRFGGLVAINNVSFCMKRRTIHSLIGPNGSGKTTMVNVIHGVFPASDGQYFFNNENITDVSTHRVARMGMGRTYQNIKLFNTMSVLDNMLVGGDVLFGNKGVVNYLMNGKRYATLEKEIIEKAEAILDFLGIYNLKDEIVSNLAYGRQKICELGRSLMSTPKLILLDEPAAGLNPTERKEFVEILQKTFESGVDLFLIEHNMDVVMNISDTVTVLSFGNKIAEGTPAEVQNDTEVIKAYLGDRYKTM